MKKRILSIIIAAMMALTFTACSKTTTDDANNPSGNDTPAVTDSVNNNGETDAPSTDGNGGATQTVSVPKYVYNTLPDEEKAIYDKILTAVQNFETEVDLGKDYPTETVLRTYKNVFFQEPEIFWFYATNEQFAAAGDTMSKVALQYRYDQSLCETMKNSLRNSLKEIESQFPENATDVDKVITIHDYIINRTVFSKDDIYSKNAYGALVGGYSQCEGYAKGLAYACNYFGIENVRITGNKYDNNSHAWSKVKIDGKWYNVDVTWDDPESSNGEQLLRHNYLFVPDSAINDITHIVICDFEPPVADSTDIDYFKYKGLYANTKEEAVSLVHDHIVEQAKKGESVCQVKCANEEVYKAALDELIQKGGYQKISDDAKAQNPQVASFGLMNDDQLFIIHFNIKYN